MEGSMFSHSMWSGHWLGMIIMACVVIIPVWRICQRTGYPGWVSILILVPLVNLGLLYFIAFSDWPADKKGAENE